MNSLRLRLLIAATLGIAVALAIAGFVIVAAFDSHVLGRLIKELDDHLLQIATLLKPEADGRASLSGELSDPQFLRPLSCLYWQVWEKGAAILRSRSLWDESIPLGDEIAAGARQVRELRGPKAKWLIVVEREEIAGNLLDNARKWARGRVKAAARREDGFVVVAVDDDSPGVPPYRVDDVLTRGARLDADTPGTGIGLGIVADLA